MTMLPRPLVTVGLPFYNEAAHLCHAIESVLCQTMRDLELLLIDDGSTDRSLEIARSFHDPRITVLSDGRRLHLPARLNEIARRARAPLLARMDADDVSHPDRLARLFALLEGRSSRVDVVGSWIALVDERGEPFAICQTQKDEPTARSALIHGVLPHASVLGRRDWFRAYPYNESLTRAEDRDLWCRTVATSRFGVVPEPLYVVRVHPRRGDFLADYRESQRQNRVLFLRYGPQALGLGATGRAWVSSLARSAIMTGAVRLGVADRIVRRRGRPPTDAERRIVREALNDSAAHSTDQARSRVR